MKKFDLVIKGLNGKDIAADCCFNEDKSSQSVLVFVHGFKGFKDWGHFNLMTKRFVELGFAVIKFNFSHNGGTVSNPVDFPDLESFGKNDFIKELNDLSAVMDAVVVGEGALKNQFLFDKFRSCINLNDISIVAHSRGGGISLIYANEDPRITKVVTWAAVSDFFARLPDEKSLDLWKRNKVLYIENGRTKQQMPMYVNFLEVMEKFKERLNIEQACRNLSIPVLVVQGGDDQVVPEEEGRNLAKWIPQSSSLLIPTADHVFGSSHPYIEEELPGETEEVINATAAFLMQ